MTKLMLPQYIQDWLKENPDVDPNNLVKLRKMQTELRTTLNIYGVLISRIESNPRIADDPRDILVMSIVGLSDKAKIRLAETLSTASYGKLAPENATIRDILQSSHDQSTLQALNRANNCNQRLLSPGVVQKIKSLLKSKYGIDYDAERAEMLASHTGLSTFIYHLDIGDWPRNAIIKYLRDHNATLQDLLMAKHNIESIDGVGTQTQEKLLAIYKEAGVDYYRFRNS